MVVFTMIDDNVYIHGHFCTHNFLMGRYQKYPNWDFHYQSILKHYLRSINKSTQFSIEIDFEKMIGYDSSRPIVYAVHPFMNTAMPEYDACCEEFGFQLPKVEYEPFCNLNILQIRETVAQFDWTQAPWEDVVNKDSWYAKCIFSQTNYSWDQWLELCKKWGSVPGDAYGKVIRTIPENEYVEYISNPNVTWPEDLPNWSDY